jgi:uncharacterized protein (DUF58 family)
MIPRWLRPLGQDDPADSGWTRGTGRLDESVPSGTGVSLAGLIALRAEARRVGLGAGPRAGATRSGGHLSPFLGLGAEYEQSRVYAHGDDPRHMDWRVTARSARAHVKVYRDERERPLWLLVDQGPSMRFATRVAFKSVIAARAAALLGWAAIERGERVGGLVFDEHGRSEHRPAARQHGLLPLLKALTPARAGGRAAGYPTPMRAAERLRQLIRPGSLVFAISDFARITADDTRWAGALAERGELVLISVNDPIELRAPPPGRYPLVSADGVRRVLDTRSAGRRALYEGRFARRYRLLQELCRIPGVHLLSLRTDLPVAASLARGLNQRLYTTTP